MENSAPQSSERIRSLQLLVAAAGFLLAGGVEPSGQTSSTIYRVELGNRPAWAAIPLQGIVESGILE